MAALPQSMPASQKPSPAAIIRERRDALRNGKPFIEIDPDPNSKPDLDSAGARIICGRLKALGAAQLGIFKSSLAIVTFNDIVVKNCEIWPAPGSADM